MSTYLKITHQTSSVSIGLLLIRVVAGLAFMHHGWVKIQHPFVWMGEQAATPGFLQALAASSEFLGGFAWVCGLLTPFASLGILCTMIGALRLHVLVKGDPFVGHGSSYELALVYFCVAILFLTLGPGTFSLDRIIFKKK